MKKAFYILAAVMSIFIISCNANTTGDKEKVTVKEAYELSKGNALIVDVREPDELAELAYDVKDVKNIPLGTLEEHLDEIPKDRQVIVVCRSGGRSGRAFEILKAKGYTNVANMEGGMNAWSGAGLPTIKNGKK